MKKVNNKVAVTEAAEVKGSKLVIEDVTAANKVEEKMALSEIVGEQLVKTTISKDDYDTLSYFNSKYWIVPRLKLIGNNQIQLTIAYGKTIKQGAIVLPCDLDLSETIYIGTDKDLFIEE